MDILSIILVVAGCIAALFVLYFVLFTCAALFAKRSFDKATNNAFGLTRSRRS